MNMLFYPTWGRHFAGSIVLRKGKHSMVNRLGINLFRTLLVVTSCLTALVAPNYALGQNISHGTNHTIGTGGELYINAWTNGSKIVADSLAVTVDTNFNQSDQQFHILATVSISGYWADANTVTPNVQYILDNGLASRNNFSFTRFTNNGDDFMVETPVNITIKSNFTLGRWFDDYMGEWDMWGYGQGEFFGEGVVPVNNSSAIWVFDNQVTPGVPNPRWHFTGDIEYRVTANMYTIPAPGASALLGLGGLIAVRRKRR